MDRVVWTLAEQPRLDAQLVPAAQLSHAQRLRKLVEQRATVFVGTPTDALRLAEAAAATHLELADSAVRLVVVTGEPGGSVPSTRRCIEERFFPARCRDVYAIAQVGVVGWQCPTLEYGVHMERPFEVDAGELVLASGYRTGDLVDVLEAPCACGRLALVVRGRKGDVLRVRGIEILPSIIENIVRRHPAVTEFRLDAYHVRGAREVAIEIEPDEAIATEGDRARVAAEVAEDVKRSLGLRLQCEAVPPGSLPRDESRPRRIVLRS